MRYREGMEEEEDGPDDIVELQGPGNARAEDGEGDRAELAELAAEPQGVDPVDLNEEPEAGMEDDMEGALEGESSKAQVLTLIYHP